MGLVDGATTTEREGHRGGADLDHRDDRLLRG
jgi:hypothetical protein